MTAERRYAFPELHPGMDHDHYAWAPLNATRPRLEWPRKAAVALCAIVVLEHTEWQPAAGSFRVANLAGGYGWGPFPDVTAWSHREYGNRVGIFRVLDVLERHGIRPTVAMDALTARHYPYLVRHCVDRGAELIGHGIAATRMITSRMSEAEENDYILTSIDAITRATGKAPAGWLGPEFGESQRTPQLLARAGIRYVCDWVNDEQPYRMTVPQGSLHALPVSLPLDDVNALWERHVDIDQYERMIRDSFDTLHRDGSQSGRLLVLSLHPFLIGQPFRIASLDTALGHIAGHEGVWTATGSEVIDWYERAGADQNAPPPSS
jgi:peptidoglycan/xylan/chitin deacetylase (PgdA/CDA1 family)